MNKKSLLALSLIGLISFSGCAPKSSCADRYGIAYETADIVAKLDLKEVFDNIVQEMYGKCAIEKSCTVGSSVIVTDFVDIDSLTTESSGFFMSELLRGSLSSKANLSIMQAEFTKYFKLSPNGLVALSRDANEIKNSEVGLGTQNIISNAIVGTYKYTPSRLYIFVKEININSGKISKQITREIPFTCVGDTVIRTDFKF